MNKQHEAAFLTSAVIWLGFVCDLLTCGLVNCNVGPNMCSEVDASSQLDAPNDLQQALIQSPFINLKF
jgi:hypothetical protein